VGTVPGARHQVIVRDQFAYCAHPHLVALDDGSWLCVFNRSVRRPLILHPPHDPHYYNVVVRSVDEGATWTPPAVVPDYAWQGVECAGLTALSGGRVLLNQWRFRWYPVDVARKHLSSDLQFPEELVAELRRWRELDADLSPVRPDALLPWARGPGGTFVHRSFDGGRTFDETVELDTTPYSGGYGMRGAVELPGGDLLLPLSDVPHYRQVFVVRSSDGGKSWSRPVAVAAEPGKSFEEPAPLWLPTGRILMLLRENQTRRLHQSVSDDGGVTWSRPVPTSIDGYPAHLLGLPDGRILCAYGHRRPEFSIRAVLSRDEGRSWTPDGELTIRGALPNGDLGYPSSVLCRDGAVFTAYYCQDPEGVTSIQGTTYRL